jgi:heterotetrameric sarcosine oxidase beta subunit
MKRYSALALLKAGLNGQRGWDRAWRDPAPKSHYDVIVIGGGGHGLSTAYYLAKVHGIRNVAVLEKGWIGGGNTGRNTTIVRSNYRQKALHDLFEFSLKLWEGMSDELNYNVMFSPRGALFLGHSDSDLTQLAQRGDALRCSGIDADLLGKEEVRKLCPVLDMSEGARFPIHGGLIQKRGGTARHDAVAWGYARAADALGVDVIQNCEVTGLTMSAGASPGWRRHAAASARGASASALRGIADQSRRLRASSCRSRRRPCRRSSPNRSSR